MPRPVSILLVDDSPGECELFRLALAQTQAQAVLHTEYDVKGALHWLSEKAEVAVYSSTSTSTTSLRADGLPALILLDWRLGPRQGAELLTGLRGDSRFAWLPVVVFTTSDEATDLYAAYAHGANGYVVKPGKFADLIHCVEDVCRYWLDRNLTPSMVTTRC